MKACEAASLRTLKLSRKRIAVCSGHTASPLSRSSQSASASASAAAAVGERGVQGRALPVCRWHARSRLPCSCCVLFCSPRCARRATIVSVSRALSLCCLYASRLAPRALLLHWSIPAGPAWSIHPPPRYHREHYGILAHPSSAMSDTHDVNIPHSCTLKRYSILVLAAASLEKATLPTCLLGRAGKNSF